MVTAEELVSQAGNFVEPLVGLAWGILQLLGIIAVLTYGWIVLSYNVKVMSRELTRSNRTVVKMHRAKVIRNKNLSHPQLKLFGIGGFGGKTINQPPSDCIYPYKTSFGNTMLYDFVVKDGVWFPIANTVLGKQYRTQDGKVVYSTEGTGLEVSRDFDAEQSTLNDLISAAEKYRNRKPGEVYMLYGVVILAVIGGFITVVYSLYKAGQVTDAVNQGWQLFREWTNIAASSKQGPG